MYLLARDVYSMNDIDKLRPGTMLISQRRVSGPKRIYGKGTLFKYISMGTKHNLYTEIKIVHEDNDDTFVTYDDYFRYDMHPENEIVIQSAPCIFDE